MVPLMVVIKLLFLLISLYCIQKKVSLTYSYYITLLGDMCILTHKLPYGSRYNYNGLGAVVYAGWQGMLLSLAGEVYRIAVIPIDVELATFNYV